MSRHKTKYFNDEELKIEIEKINMLPIKEKKYSNLEVIEKLEMSIKEMKNKNYTYQEIQKYLKDNLNIYFKIELIKLLSDYGYKEFSEEYKRLENEKKYKTNINNYKDKVRKNKIIKINLSNDKKVINN
jgi:hypothetical protein